MERLLRHDVADSAYLEFFGLARSPFARLSDPSQLFPTEQYSLLMEHLNRAATNADSLVVLCGAAGSGKSTLLDRFLSTIDDQVSYVVINQDCGSEEEFYCEFLTQIGFEDISGTANELRNIAKEFLVCRGIAGDHVLLIIDNAHLAEPKILEQLRWLCELKVKDRRVLSVVLSGNADIIRVVDAPAMRQVKFPNHAVFSIRSYTQDETAAYVWHRLKLAGGNDSVAIPKETSSLIHRYSGGIPQLINELCHDVLIEAYDLNSRVISEKIVRSVADKQQLLPHVIPLHGRGRRKSDPDFENVRAVPEEPSTKPEDLQKHIAQLSEQVDDLRTDKSRALQELDARNNDIAALRDELDTQTAEVQKLRASIADNANEISRQSITLSDSSTELQESEKRSKKLAADLEKEIHARETAEKALAEATTTVDELTRKGRELQATLQEAQSDFEARRKIADERADAIEALEESTAALRVEIESKSQELEEFRNEMALRDTALADLQSRLDESQADYESAQVRIAELKSPQELEEIRKTSDQIAAKLKKETRAREAAQKSLSEATATVDELTRQRRELQASLHEAQSELRTGRQVADERAEKIRPLEQGAAALRDEIESKSQELEELRDEMALRDKSLADLQARLDESQADYESAQILIAELKSPEELEEVRKSSDQIAAELKKEVRAKEAAQESLSEATATVDELTRQRSELQASLQEAQSDLKAGRKVADERADAIEALEESAAAFRVEIESKSQELEELRSEMALRDKAFADLQTRLEESQNEFESAQVRIAELKSPQELEEVREDSVKTAARLRQEEIAREVAENELAKSKLKVQELKQLEQEMRTTIHNLNADLRAAGEHAVNVYVLEKTVADLKSELANTTRELGMRNDALEDLEIQLEASQDECEVLRRNAAALALDQKSQSQDKSSASTQSAPDEASPLVDEFDQLYGKLAAYRTLQKKESASYDGLRDTYQQLVSEDLTDKQIQDRMRAEQARLMEQRLPGADDNAIVAYVRLILDQLDDFIKEGTEPCLTFLIPKANPEEDTSAVYSDEHRKRELDTLSMVFNNFEADRRLPKEEDAWPDLEPIFAEMLKKFGADNVAAIENSYDPNVDRALVAEASKVLYSGILDLPRRKAADAVRWLMTAN